MNEQEFIIKARKLGINDKIINGSIGAYNRLKEFNHEMTYEEILDKAIRIQKDEAENPRGPLDCG